MNIVTKATGDSLTANEFNQIPDEIENAILSAGLLPDNNILDQLAKGVSQLTSDGRYFSTSGTANAIILSTISPRKELSLLTNGLEFIFKATANNTGATTINICNLGAKDVYKNNIATSGGEIIANEYYRGIYNSTDDRIDITEYAVPKPLFIDVVTNGAKGDGVTDDTVAIQNILDNAPAFSTIYFNGLFKISDELIIDKPFIIKGNGGKTIGNLARQTVTQGIFQTTQNKNIFTLKPNLTTNPDGNYSWSYYPPSSYGLGNLRFEDIFLKGYDKSATGGTAIGLFENTNNANWHFVNVVFRNVQITNCNIGVNLYSWTAYDINFENCGFTHCVTGIMTGRDNGDIGAGKIFMDNVDMYWCDLCYDAFTHQSRGLVTRYCNFAYNTTVFKCRQSFDYKDICSGFEDNTYAYHIVTSGSSSNRFVFIGTGILANPGFSPAYSIYMDYQISWSWFEVPMFLIGTIVRGADFEISKNRIVHVLTVDNRLSSAFPPYNCKYTDYLNYLRVNSYQKVSTLNLPRFACGSADVSTPTIYKILKLADGETLKIWANVRASFTDGTTISGASNRVYKSDGTTIYNGYGTGDNWREYFGFADEPLTSYTNSSGSDEIVYFACGGSGGGAKCFAMFLYTVTT